MPDARNFGNGLQVVDYPAAMELDLGRLTALLEALRCNPDVRPADRKMAAGWDEGIERAKSLLSTFGAAVRP